MRLAEFFRWKNIPPDEVFCTKQRIAGDAGPYKKEKGNGKPVPFVSATKSEIAAVSGLSSLIAESIEIAAAVFAYGKAISKEKGNGKPFPLFLHQNRKPC